MTFILTLFLLAARGHADDPRPAVCELHLGGVTYRLPRLSGAGRWLKPRAAVASELVLADPQVRSLGERFRFDGLTRAYRPFRAFTLFERARFSRPGATDVLDLLVKSPGMDFALPAELEQFGEACERIYSFEHMVNPRADDLYAYLTVHQSMVSPGETQRTPGWQLDGFQGVERQPADEIDHSYLVTDALPEVFTSQQFQFRSFNYQLFNVFSELDRQARPEFELPGEPYQVYLTNAYTAHRAPVATAATTRTFLRVTFSRARFDKLGSSENPMLHYSWPRREKTLRRGLAKYVPSLPLDLLPETHSLEAVRGERLGLVSLGGADARVAAHVAEMLITSGRQVEFVASVGPAPAYRGGRVIDEDLLRLDATFEPRRPIAEAAFSERLPTYLIFTTSNLMNAIDRLVTDHGVDGLVIVDVGGRALTPLFAQEMHLLEHRIQDAVIWREGLAHRTLVVVSPGFGLPADAAGTRFARVRRYRPTEADRRRVEVSATRWDQTPPGPRPDEVAAQLWRQALAQRFGPQEFSPLNAHDPLIDVKPNHQDLIILPLEDVRTSAVRPVR